MPVAGTARGVHGFMARRLTMTIPQQPPEPEIPPQREPGIEIPPDGPTPDLPPEEYPQSEEPGYRAPGIEEPPSELPRE
jgi:hypothetical protein